MELVNRKAQTLSASILVLAFLTVTPSVAQGDPIAFTDLDGTSITYSSQVDGFNMTVQDARGVSTLYRYNDAGQLLFEDAPEQGLLSYRYDEQGRPFQIEMESDISSKLKFDEKNRVTRQIWREGSDERIVTRYRYDNCENGAGKLCRVVHNDHVMRYGYTVDGKLAFVKAKLADEEAVETISYNYGDDGLLKSMHYPSGLRVAYRYDAQSRVSALTGVYKTGDDRERFSILRAIRYDATGRVIGFTHGNGVKTRYRYNDEGRLVKITLKQNGEIVGKEVYVYNEDGLIESIDRLNGSYSRSYSYDTEGRLASEEHGDGTAINTTIIGYSYDAVGNRLNRTIDGRTKHYSYSPDANQLQSIGQQDVNYDARGNLLEDRSGSRSFEYDATNRMDAFYRNGELKAEYDYDVNGLRIRKRLHRPNGTGVKSVRYLYNTDGRLISETFRRADRRAAKARDLVWLGPIPVAQIERTVKENGVTRKANVLSLHADYLGAPRQAKREDGATVWSWYGDAFGAKAGRLSAVNRDPDGDGKKTEISLRFPGQYHDVESGLWYNHNRDYDPKLGRYVQSDPIGLKGGINRYTYVSNKPTYLIDPSGLAEICYYEGTGYTPNRSDDSRGPVGDASGPEPEDVIVVTGDQQSNNPRRKCIHIPDPQPIIPSVPQVPTTPSGPTGPTGPNNGDGGNEDSGEESTPCTPLQDAVADAIRNAFGDSSSAIREFGGLIYQYPNGSTGATLIAGTFSGVRIWDSRNQVPPGATVVAGWHTHPSGSIINSLGQSISGNDYFSPGDHGVARNSNVYGRVPQGWHGLGLGFSRNGNITTQLLSGQAAANGNYTIAGANSGAEDISHCGTKK